MSADTIIIIEDNPDDVYFIRRAFLKAGLTNPLEIAYDGEAGLKLLKALAQKSKGKEDIVLPLFVLLDLKLPKLNGFQILESIRNIPELAKLVVIILSSSNIEADILLAYELGARSYLVKPPEPADLIAIVSTVHLHASRGWLEPLEFGWARKRPSGKRALIPPTTRPEKDDAKNDNPPR
jgi:CheY-like chemotaxis protein